MLQSLAHDTAELCDIYGEELSVDWANKNPERSKNYLGDEFSKKDNGSLIRIYMGHFKH